MILKMRSSSLTLLVTVAVPLVLGAFQQHFDAVPANYEALDTLGSSTTAFTIALALNNLDQLESKLLALSTPGSAEYGQFLDVDGIQDLFGPTEDAVSSVTTWLESAGITDYVHEGLFVNFNADVDTVNTLLNSTYTFFNHEGVTKLRTLSYTIPRDVEGYIALIEPGIYFGQTKAAATIPSRRTITPAPVTQPKVLMRQSGNSTTVQPTVDAACATILTPACVKQLYNVGNYTPLATSGSRVAFGSFLNESAILSDLFAFETTYGIPFQNLTLVSIDNGTLSQDVNDPNIGFGEANLDAQNIVGLVHPLPVTEYSTGGLP